MVQQFLLSFNRAISASTVHVIAQRISTSWQWYIIRGAGFVAAGLLILLMLTGIGKVTGIIYRFLEPIKVQVIHKAMGMALLVSIAIHGGFLLIDHYVPFSLVQILIPFSSHYNNGTKLWGIPLGGIAVSLGILAMYGIVIIVASSLGWINSKKKTWRQLHYLSYAVIYLVLLHGLYVGTDLRYGNFRRLWILIGFIISLGVIARLWHSGVMKHRTIDNN